jgi:arylsulfatase A-like enzyme
VSRFALARPALLLPFVFGACRRSSDVPLLPAAAASVGPADATAPSRPAVLDVVRDLDSCSLGHKGILLDFGDPSSRASLRPGLVSRGDDEVVEHEGATWVRVRSRTVTASFYWPEVPSETAGDSAFAQARVRGLAARAASVAIDGRPIGAWSLVRGETRVVEARASSPMLLSTGSHELTIRFVGGPRSAGEPLAEIDWVHLGTGETNEPYAAPTRADALVDGAIGGRSMRALAMRAPSFVRCSGWIPSNATLEMSLAAAGGGEADVEALLLRDRRAPVVLGTAHVAGGDGSAWRPWSLPVLGLEGAGALASMQLVVERASKGTRVLFGEPRVVAADAGFAGAPPPVRGVVLVVLGSTSARVLGPWGGAQAVPELSRLAATGTLFASNRAPSSLASAALASMLTGLPPRIHGLDDPDARLPDGPTSVEDACRQGGIATAMFTANPTTGAAFGFARGWSSFSELDPLGTAPATQVFEDASAWIDAHKREPFLLVVHARGGHPPWDATPDDLKSMQPEGYLGMVDPARAAEALAKARKHPGRFKEDDRARAWALYDRSIEAHDEALGRLLATLRTAGREEDTAVIVTGDVGASEASPVPFGDTDALDEPLLATPLVIRWPGDAALAGRRVDRPSSPIDLAKTIVRALGLAPPSAFEGVDLAEVADGALVPAERALLATHTGRFSVRWSSYVLLGARDRETRMCDLALDPACVADVRTTSPLALESVHRWAVDALGSITSPPYPRVPALLDEHTTAALVRWGRPTEDRDVDER